MHIPPEQRAAFENELRHERSKLGWKFDIADVMVVFDRIFTKGGRAIDPQDTSEDDYIYIDPDEVEPDRKW